jgi:hypothetical protein
MSKIFLVWAFFAISIFFAMGEAMAYSPPMTTPVDEASIEELDRDSKYNVILKCSSPSSVALCPDVTASYLCIIKNLGRDEDAYSVRVTGSKGIMVSNAEGFTEKASSSKKVHLKPCEEVSFQIRLQASPAALESTSENYFMVSSMGHHGMDSYTPVLIGKEWIKNGEKHECGTKQEEETRLANEAHTGEVKLRKEMHDREIDVFTQEPIAACKKWWQFFISGHD